jgi:amidohydrolase
MNEKTQPAIEVNQFIADEHPNWTTWRRELHAQPELAFEEHKTADFVAKKLLSFGFTVHRGIGKTGVVGVLKVGTGPGMIGLRADMDALPMQENNLFAHTSRIRGCMHACGHDGHTAMLLGAAQLLALTKSFNGTVVVIFQPAEEAAGGGRAMVEDGLFERFPVDAVFGMHNIPGIPAGHFGCMPGPMMASFDAFDITVNGHGGHAAFPHKAVDTIHASAQLITQIHSIVSRQTDPFDPTVVSVTSVQGGESYNILPAAMQLKGTVRAFKTETQDFIEASIRRLCAGIDASFGTTTTLGYDRRYPPTVNSAPEALRVQQLLVKTFGDSRVLMNAQALMAAEDFAFMLQRKPGAYVWIGNGLGEEGGCMVHNPKYDFNDRIMPNGVLYWVKLTEHWLA